MWNSCTSVLLNTGAWEQQEYEIGKEMEEKSKKKGASIERSKAGTKEKKVPTTHL